MHEDRIIRTFRNFPFSKESLYAAFVDPDCLATWWGPKDFTNTFETFEFKVGGDWIFTMHGPNGADFPNHNVFDEIIPNEKIVLRHVGHPNFTLTMLFEDADTSANVTWLAEFENKEMRDTIAKFAKDANEENFDRWEAAVR